MLHTMSMPPALFAYGFRPFFLLAGLAALALVPWWAASFAFGVPLGTGWPPSLWHSHEMLFGFISAALAGFLLTAVPNWTGQRGFTGRPLVVLATLWMLGRLLVGGSRLWPLPLVAAVDLAFLPALAALVAQRLLRARNRNTPLLIVLGALWSCNASFYWALAHSDAQSAARGVVIGIDVMLVLVTIIGGRIVPEFTGAALKASGSDAELRSWSGMTPLAVGLMVATTIADMFAPDGAVAGSIAGAAALVQAARLLQWRTLRSLRTPIVWVLHLAYAWLPIGLGLKALALLDGAALGAFWLHALTVGALTTMILGVMTRAALGHTGRPLAVAPLVVVAYGLLTLAAVVRVFGLAWSGMRYPGQIVLSALLWTGAFVLFVAIYAPMLWSARVDGKPG